MLSKLSASIALGAWTSSLFSIANSQESNLQTPLYEPKDYNYENPGLFRNFKNYDYTKIHNHNNLNKNARDYKTGGIITVHVCPHSHDDVGWLKTVDQYFYGEKNYIQRTNVNVEYSSVTAALLDNPQRKFMVVEIKFFKMWWDLQTDDLRNKVRGLVRNKQLEFVNAGWSMHDEACPIYEDMIDNMMYGHDFVLKEFGEKPRIGWQIDPFGHSNTNSRIFSEMGFDGLFFARLDHNDKARRHDEREMEFIWQPNSQSLGKDVNIFTHVLWNHYSAPGGFSMYMTGDNQPFIIDKNSTDFNAEDRAQDLMNELNDRSQHYMTDDLFVVFGDDFKYMNAPWMFESLDNLIKYMNENHGDQYFFKYSTPSDYIDAMKKHDVEWPTKQDDMMPYSNDWDDFWNGYYTSRANSKAYIRAASHNLHASSQLFSEKLLDQTVTADKVEQILEANQYLLDQLGINQHHDAVSGTAKQAVANDYSLRLFKGLTKNNDQYGQILGEKIEKESEIKIQDPKWSTCTRTNATYLDCPISNYVNSTDYNMTVAVHNPSTLDLKAAQILVPHGNYEVQVFDKESQQFVNAESVVNCFDDHLTNGNKIENCQLNVNIDTPSHSFSVFKVSAKPQADLKSVKKEIKLGQALSSGNLQLELINIDSEESTLYFKLTDLLTQKTELIDFSVRFWFSYVKYGYGNSNNQEDGPYVFRPMAGQTDSLPYGQYYNGSVSVSPKGIEQMDFYFQTHMFDDNTTWHEKSIVHVSIDPDLDVIRFDLDLDSLPINETPYDGYNVIAQFRVSDFDNNKTFYTDSNGLEMQQRILNKRPTWNFTLDQGQQNENITANYYPINSAISMKEAQGSRQFTVMNSRSQGGSALRNGMIEFMQNREIPQDDNKGVAEWLQEKDEFGNGIRVPATYFVQVFDSQKRVSLQRQVQHKQDDPAQYFFSFDPLELSGSKKSQLYFENELKEAGVVDTIKYATIPRAKNEILLRVFNIGDLYDQNSQTYNVSVKKILDTLWMQANVAMPVNYLSLDIKEMSLTGNMAIEEMLERKVQWKTFNHIASNKKLDFSVGDFENVSLEPQRIRVFLAKFTPQSFDENTERFLQ